MLSLRALLWIDCSAAAAVGASGLVPAATSFRSHGGLRQHPIRVILVFYRFCSSPQCQSGSFSSAGQRRLVLGLCIHGDRPL
jgi:hypothetical protein